MKSGSVLDDKSIVSTGIVALWRRIWCTLWVCVSCLKHTNHCHKLMVALLCCCSWKFFSVKPQAVWNYVISPSKFRFAQRHVTATPGIINYLTTQHSVSLSRGARAYRINFLFSSFALTSRIYAPSLLLTSVPCRYLMLHVSASTT